MVRPVRAILVTLVVTVAAGAGPRTDAEGRPLPDEAIHRFGSGKFDGGPFALAAFSRDGKVVFTAGLGDDSPSPRGTGLTAWEVATGKALWTWQEDCVLSAQPSDDGKSVLVVSGKSRASAGRIRLHRLKLADGKSLEDRELSSGFASNATATGDGWISFAEQGNQGFAVVVVDPKGKEALRYQSDKDAGFGQVHLSPDRRVVVFTGYSRFGMPFVAAGVRPTQRLAAVSIRTGNELWAADAVLSDVAISPDGKWVYSLSPATGRPVTPATLRRHNAATGKADTPKPVADADGVAASGRRLLSVRPDGKAVYVRGGANETLVVDAETLKVESRLNAALFEGWHSPDGTLAASTSGRTLTLHELPSGKRRAVTSAPIPVCRWPEYQFSGDGKTVTRVGGDTAITWDLKSGTEQGRVPPAKMLSEGAPGLPVTADTYQKNLAARSPDGKSVLHYHNPTIQQLQFKTKLTVNGAEWPDAQLEQRLVGCLQMAFTRDGRYALAQFDQEHCHIWDLTAEASAGEAITFAVPGPSGYRQLPLMHPAPDSKRVALVELDPKVARVEPRLLPRYRWQLGIFDLATRRRTAGLSGAGVLTSLDWSTATNHIGGTGQTDEDRWFAFVAAPNGRFLMELLDLRRPVTACAVSPDGRTLAIGFDGVIQLYEVHSRRLRHTFRPAGGPARVLALRFHPNGRTLVSEAADGDVYLWDVAGESLAPARPDADALAALWADLQGDDATKAFRAARRLARFPALALPFLAGKVVGQKRATAREIEDRVARLKSREYSERENAEKDLRVMGRVAWPALKAAVAADSSPELQTRAGRLLAATSSPVGIRTSRLVEVVELMGTKEAHDCLKTWAASAGPELASEATDALDRRRN